jgi:hypothetical protein
MDVTERTVAVVAQAICLRRVRREPDTEIMSAASLDITDL